MMRRWLDSTTKRNPLLRSRAGPAPKRALYKKASTRKNNLPDALARWNGTHKLRARTGAHDRAFCVPKAEIVPQAMNLSPQPLQELI